MRLLTFNLWHGLSPASVIAFEALEPAGRRLLREQVQIDLLTTLKPDVCFFQEVNPVLRRAPVLARAMAATYTFQPDLVGLKLFGWGVPINLNSGLVITAPHNWGLKKIAGASLSRPRTRHVRSWGSWQTKEERFALFSEVILPEGGRALLINTHFHHGLESTLEFDRDWQALEDRVQLTPPIKAEIRSRITSGNKRRLRELDALLKVLAEHQNRYDTVILAGDFNASPENSLSAVLRDHGFCDVWPEKHPQDEGCSFDGITNHANHLLQNKFPLTVKVDDLPLSPSAKDALLTLARRQEEKPRRIDYIWVRSKSAAVKVKEAQLVGLPNSEGLAASDHFGVCVDLDLE